MLHPVLHRGVFPQFYRDEFYNTHKKAEDFLPNMVNQDLVLIVKKLESLISVLDQLS